MKININKPEPVVQPPTTYDLVGLTLLQLQIIINMVGSLNVSTIEDYVSDHAQRSALGHATTQEIRDELNDLYNSLKQPGHSLLFYKEHS
jgi:hypothetical protein